MRIQYRDSDKSDLGPLTPLLDARQARIARKLIGLSLLLGDRTLSVLHHFAESVALFLAGRVLLWLIESLHITPLESARIHGVSHWYEIAVFAGFCVSSFVEIVFFTWHELRRVVKHPEGSG